MFDPQDDDDDLDSSVVPQPPPSLILPTLGAAPNLPPDDSSAAPQFDLQKLLASPSVSTELKAAAAKKIGATDYSPEARQQLVDRANGPDWGGAIGASLAAIGAGFQGQNSAAAANMAMERSQKQNQQKVTNFDQSRQAALDASQTDPDSEASQRFRATLKANFPQIAEKYGDHFDDLTAADQKNVFQVTETKAKLDEAAAKRESVAATKDLNSQLHRDAQDQKASQKATEQDNKDAQNLDKHLSLGWTGRSGQAGVVQGKINAAEAAQALLEQAKTQPGGLDSRQVEELAQSTSRLLGGGTQASARVDALVPHTFWGNAQSLKEYLSNSPQGAGLQAFTDRLAETVQREKALAENQKRQFQIEGLAPYSRLKKNNPDLYNSTLSSRGLDGSMINEKGQYQQPKVPVKTQTNTKTGEKRIVYSDGSTEIVSNGQVAGGG